MRMKIGDVVLPRNLVSFDTTPGYGVVVDFYESDDGVPFYEVAWPGTDRTWWDEMELELISEG